MKKNTTTWKKVVASSMALLMVASGFSFPVNPTLIKDFSLTANAETETTTIMVDIFDNAAAKGSLYFWYKNAPDAVQCAELNQNNGDIGKDYYDDGKYYRYYVSIPKGSTFCIALSTQPAKEDFLSSNEYYGATVSLDNNDNIKYTYDKISAAPEAFEFSYATDMNNNPNAASYIQSLNGGTNPIGITVLDSSDEEVTTADAVREGKPLTVLLDTSALPADVYITSISYAYKYMLYMEDTPVEEDTKYSIPSNFSIDEDTGKVKFSKDCAVYSGNISVTVTLADCKPYEYPEDEVKGYLAGMYPADANNMFLTELCNANGFIHDNKESTVTIPAVPLQYWNLNPQASAFYADESAKAISKNTSITFYNQIKDSYSVPFSALILEDDTNVQLKKIKHQLVFNDSITDENEIGIFKKDAQFVVLKPTDANGKGKLTVGDESKAIECYNYTQFGGKVTALIYATTTSGVRGNVTVSFSDENSSITLKDLSNFNYFNVLTPLKYTDSTGNTKIIKVSQQSISGLSSFSGKELTLASTSLEGATVTVSDGGKFKYTGKEIAPTFTVKLENDTELQEGDYTITGTTKATDAGTYKVKIKGNDPYEGELDAEWTIGYRVDITACGKIKTDDAAAIVTKDVFPQKKTVTVVADTEKGGWYIDNKLVSTQKEYTFYVTNNVNLEWKANTSDVSDIKPVTDVELSNRKTTANNKVSVVFGSTWQVPEGAKVTKAGIYRTFIANDATKLPTQKEMLKGTFKSVTDLNKGNYCFILNMGTTSASKKLCAMSFVQYEKNGKTYTICSDIVTSQNQSS